MARYLRLLLSFFLVLAATMPALSQTAAAPDQAAIYLIAVDDNGQSGPRVGCGDSLIPVQVDIGTPATTEARITAALERLFAINAPFYGQSGLYNALHQSRLRVESVKLDFHMAPNDRAVVHLSGSLLSAGTCDDPRIIGQITATVQQFPGITHVAIVYNNDLLEFVLSQRGEHPDYRYFPVTDHLVGHGFLRYWEQFGGLPIFGYPLTEEVPGSGAGTAQWFERARFEWYAGVWPERHDVLLGRIGVDVARQRGLLSTQPFQPVPEQTRANCTYYPATRHFLCAGFRAFWERFGGLALYGFPISEEYLDPATGLRVQYFERARFEWQPGTAPARYDVVLGRVGAELLGR